jgi:hypothetical protein
VLAEHAATLPVRGLQNVALHLVHTLDPDQGERLAKEEQAQVARREFRLRPNPDGSARPDGYLDKEATALLRAALDPLAKPRPDADGTPDPRTPPQRTGDALVELIELALRSGQLPTQAGQPVQLVITIALSDLETRLARANTNAAGANSNSNAGAGAGAGAAGAGGGAAGGGGGRFHGAGAGVLDDGLPLSADTVRRLACDCQVIPIVLGSHGEPLNVGRASREATPAIRRALDVRDKGCSFPGCDRPPRWAVVHHIVHWADGGPTSCGNCVLLCGHHHRVVHHDGWDVHIETDGLPTFYPPAWIDPQRTPRRHHRHPTHPSSGRSDDGPAPVLPFTLTRTRR